MPHPTRVDTPAGVVRACYATAQSYMHLNAGFICACTSAMAKKAGMTHQDVIGTLIAKLKDGAFSKADAVAARDALLR